jgi:myo-inositol 2-dehydrogenase/D-chiro-inositol 1-dehydrogenase
MTIGFGLLGAGRIGTVHARAIRATTGARLIAVADAVPAAAERLAAATGAAVRSIDAIAGAADVDAVLVCSPTDTHADLIERFAEAGKGIFCEKPVDLSVERARRCLALVERAGARLMIGFQRRFDPDFRALKAAVDDGAVGTVEMVTLTSRDPGPPPYAYIERSGGIFRDMTIHDFDVARWLLGEEVAAVTAVGSVLVDPEIGRRGDFDSVNVILATASGRQCTITNTRRATYGYDQRVEVLGSQGAVSLGNVHRSRVEVATAGGYIRPPLEDFFMTRYAAAYAAEIAAFVAALTDGTAIPVTGHDGLMALVLAEAAGRSAAEGRTVPVAEVVGARERAA